MLLTIAPYFGYLASLFLIISLVVNNDLRFRWFNTAGCLAFMIYAILLDAFPVLLTNSILFCINIYYLRKIYTKNEFFDLFEFDSKNQLLLKFSGFYKQDINTYFPQFEPKAFDQNFNFAVIRDLVIANVFSVAITENGDAEVAINYTIPKFRDYKVGTFIFEKEKELLISKGVKRIVYKEVFNKNHAEFLSVMGFKRIQDKEGVLTVKELQ